MFERFETLTLQGQMTDAAIIEEARLVDADESGPGAAFCRWRS